MLYKKDLFNENTLCIFTDASVMQLPNEFISCPGVHVVYKDSTVSQVVNVLRNSTNNEGEATAILMGIREAVRLKKVTGIESRINLFSDSIITVRGLTEWVFNWVNNTSDGIMYGSSKQPVANQQIILEIIYTILENKLQVNICHTRGHMNPDNRVDFMKAKKNFIKVNGIDEEVADDLIKAIIAGNDVVDNITRIPLEILRQRGEDKVRPIKPTPLVSYTYTPELNSEMDMYKELITRKFKE